MLKHIRVLDRELVPLYVKILKFENYSAAKK